MTHGGGALSEGPSCESLRDIAHSGPSNQGLLWMEMELDQHESYPRSSGDIGGHREGGAEWGTHSAGGRVCGAEKAKL